MGSETNRTTRPGVAIRSRSRPVLPRGRSRDEALPEERMEMSHYGGHMRDAFCELIEEWAAAGKPPASWPLEEDFSEEEWPTPTFLREFLGCTDILPRSDRDLVLGILGEDDEQEVITYARAASRLLSRARSGATAVPLRFVRSCVACLRKNTDTVLAFKGDAEWVAAGLMALGVPEDEAGSTVAYALTGRVDEVPEGEVSMIFRVCETCAERPGFPVVPVAAGEVAPIVPRHAPS